MLPKNSGYQRTLRPKLDAGERLAKRAQDVPTDRHGQPRLYLLAGNTTGAVTNLFNGKSAPSIEAVASIAWLHAERDGDPQAWAEAIADLFDDLTLDEAAERDAQLAAARVKSAA